MRRRDLAALLCAAPMMPAALHAQAVEQPRRIGMLINYAENDPEGQSRLAAVRETLRELGWVEGKSLRIDIRWAAGKGDLATTYAAELAGLPLAAILVNSTPLVAALQKATQTIPIVFAQVSDPVGSGFVASLARPGGNTTGYTDFEAATAGKWVELLKEVSPSIVRVGVLLHPGIRNQAVFLSAIESAAQALKVRTVTIAVRDKGEIEPGVDGFAGEAGSGLIVVPNPVNNTLRQPIIAAAARFRLPAIYPFRYYAAGGGLLSYGVEQIEQWPGAARYLHRILRGEKPADLPIQAPIKYTLTINLGTARALGLNLSSTLLARADEVIE